MTSTSTKTLDAARVTVAEDRVWQADHPEDSWEAEQRPSRSVEWHLQTLHEEVCRLADRVAQLERRLAAMLEAGR